ncbi:hypothetical protein B5S32_g1388 [[Candida] boidinii]|nr:hypothetical protein B5S32_g1388 [[Candida] boidinii]
MIFRYSNSHESVSSVSELEKLNKLLYAQDTNINNDSFTSLLSSDSHSKSETKQNSSNDTNNATSPASRLSRLLDDHSPLNWALDTSDDDLQTTKKTCSLMNKSPMKSSYWKINFDNDNEQIDENLKEDEVESPLTQSELIRNKIRKDKLSSSNNQFIDSQITSIALHENNPFVAIANSSDDSNLMIYDINTNDSTLIHLQTITLPGIHSMKWLYDVNSSVLTHSKSNHSEVNTDENNYSFLLTGHDRGYVNLTRMSDPRDINDEGAGAEIIKRYNHQKHINKDYESCKASKSFKNNNLISSLNITPKNWKSCNLNSLISIYKENVFLWDSSRSSVPILKTKSRGVNFSDPCPNRDGLLGLGGSFGVSLFDMRSKDNLGLTSSFFLPHEDNDKQSTILKWSNNNSNYLASGELSGLIKVWDIRVSKPLLCLKGHTDEITSMSWSNSNNGDLYSSSKDGNIIHWKLSTINDNNIDNGSSNNVYESYNNNDSSIMKEVTVVNSVNLQKNFDTHKIIDTSENNNNLYKCGNVIPVSNTSIVDFITIIDEEDEENCKLLTIDQSSFLCLHSKLDEQDQKDEQDQEDEYVSLSEYKNDSFHLLESIDEQLEDDTPVETTKYILSNSPTSNFSSSSLMCSPSPSPSETVSSSSPFSSHQSSPLSSSISPTINDFLPKFCNNLSSETIFGNHNIENKQNSNSKEVKNQEEEEEEELFFSPTNSPKTAANKTFNMKSTSNIDLRDSRETSSVVKEEDRAGGSTKMKGQPNLKRFSYHPTSPTTDIDDSNDFEERFSTKSYSNPSSRSASSSKNSNHQNPLQRPHSVFDNLHSPTIRNSIKNSLNRQKNNNKTNEDYLQLEDDFFIGFDPKDEINNILDTIKDSSVSSSSESSSSTTTSLVSLNRTRSQSSKEGNSTTKQKINQHSDKSIAQPGIENCENYNPTSLDVIEELLEMLNFQITVINGETYV